MRPEVSKFKKSNLFRLVKEIINLPVKKYDLVINDFEPVSAQAAMLRKVLKQEMKRWTEARIEPTTTRS